MGTDERRWAAFRYLGPNWYAAIMGTAIIPGAGIALPHQFPGALRVWQVFAVLAFLELLVLVVARGLHWYFHTDQARADLLDPTVAPFYACISLAFLATGWATPFSWGTIVTGMNVVSHHTGIEALGWFTVAMYVGLCVLFLYTWPQTLWGLIKRRLPASPA